jgi:hypothetical protein
MGCETIYAFIYRAAQEAEQLWRYLTVAINAAVRADRDLHKIRSVIASPSTNGPRMSTPGTEGGYWEGGVVICQRTRPLLVLHERKSRVTDVKRPIGAASLFVGIGDGQCCPTRLTQTQPRPAPTAGAESAELRLARSIFGIPELMVTKHATKRGRPRTGRDPVVLVRLPLRMIKKIDRLADALDADRSKAIAGRWSKAWHQGWRSGCSGLKRPRPRR